MLFRDNLIIRLVLAYRSKENLRFKLSNSFLFHFFIRNSTVSHLFPAVKSIQAHLQPRSQGLSSYLLGRALGGKMRDPGNEVGTSSVCLR